MKRTLNKKIIAEGTYMKNKTFFFDNDILTHL